MRSTADRAFASKPVEPRLYRFDPLIPLSAFATIGFLVVYDAGWIAYFATLLVALSGMLVLRGTKTGATKLPFAAQPQATLHSLIARLREFRTGDPTFAADLEKIRAEQPPMPGNPWDS